jgi:hypothetical protein
MRLSHIRLLHPGVAIVQATVSYSRGITLKDGERIPLYSEIRTVVVAKNQKTWQIAAHNFLLQGLPTTSPAARRGSRHSQGHT